MRILVTGGAGYIGSHTAKFLAAAGHEPVVFDDMSQGHELGGQVGDARARQSARIQCDSPMSSRPQKVDAVVHFAANALVGESMTDPAKYFRNNTVGTLNLLDAMRDAGVGTFVFSSRARPTAIRLRVPIDETHPQAPVNPYGESKLMVEKILRWYGEATDCAGSRCGTSTPPGRPGRRRSARTTTLRSHLIPLVIGAAQGTRPPVKISAPTTRRPTAPPSATTST